MKSKTISFNKYYIFYFRDEEKEQNRNKPKSINMMKDVRKLYQPYYPKILRDSNSNGFKYNLSEESIFGNLYYSMNTDLLKGKPKEYHSISTDKNYSNIQRGPKKLIPILRYKKAKLD